MQEESTRKYSGKLPLLVEGRDTRVFQIDGLRELGRKNPVPWTGQPEGKNTLPSVLRPDGKRIDILGRRLEEGPWVMWSTPLP